jgi:cytochrome P450
MPEATPPGNCDAFDDLDIHSRAFSDNPYPVYDQLRQGCPVLHSDLYGGFWLFTRYEDVKNAALDWRRYTSSVVGVTAIPIITPRTEPMLPIELDPPLHSRYRALVNPVFSADRVEKLREPIHALVEQLVEAFLAKGSGDLVADYAVPLSVGALAIFTGLPPADSHLWVGWLDRMFNPKDPAGVKAASEQFGLYIDQLIAQRHRQPTGDFISLLIESEVDGQRLTDAELHSYCTVIFGAGFETTADALSVMLGWLAAHPEDWAHLKAEPGLIGVAVEEFLRFSSPIQIFGRNASHDLEVHGQAIPGGDVVALGFGAANHDPAVFPEAGRCILDRSPNRHVAFGAGPHICLGAPVARLEMQITLAVMLRRLTGFTLAAGVPLEWKPRGDRRGLARLPVVLVG